MKTILCYGDSLTWGYNPPATRQAGMRSISAGPEFWNGSLAKDFALPKKGSAGERPLSRTRCSPTEAG